MRKLVAYCHHFQRKRAAGFYPLNNINKRHITCVSTSQFKNPSIQPGGNLSFKSKWELVDDILINKGYISSERGDVFIREAEPIAVEHLVRVHCENYVSSFLDGTMSADMSRRIGFRGGVITKEIFDRVMHVTGATLQASLHALSNSDGRAANLAGGGHHAYRDRGSGYCVFNDIVVAGEALIEMGKIKKYLVVDLDVHQGDGTAAMLAGKDHAFTFSMHGEKNFPMKKQKSNWDVALADDTQDEEYLSIIDKCLNHMLQKRGKHFQYDFVFYQAGADVLKGDGLGRLALSMDGIRERDELVFRFIKESSCPVVALLGGGYPKGKHTVEIVASAHAQTIHMLSTIK